ncbi:hypothetical protein [Gemmatimonas sp.]
MGNDANRLTAAIASDELPRELRETLILTVEGNTPAYNIFGAQLIELEALLSLALASEKLRMTDTPRSEFFLQSRIDRIENDYSGPWHIEVRPLMLRWQIVMHVTAAEVYLKEALTTLALFDPNLMAERDSKQEWKYDDVRAATDRDSMLREFCYRWARSIVDGSGGPAKWVRWLVGLGVPALSDDDISTLEGVWGLRHLQVHSGGHLTPEFIRRHRSLADKLYREGLTLDDLLGWRALIEKFVKGVETAVSGRLKARLAPQIAAGQERTGEYMMEILRRRYDDAVAELGEDELVRRANSRVREAEERFWRMNYTTSGDPPTYPGEDWMEGPPATIDSDDTV